MTYRKTIRSYKSVYFTTSVLSGEGKDIVQEKQVKPEKGKVTREAGKPAENVVLIGRKPVMNYVVACLTIFNAGEKEVVVKARGQAISRAVDTVELLRRAFVKDLELIDIKIGTKEITRPYGPKSNVSTIDIIVTKAESK